MSKKPMWTKTYGKVSLPNCEIVDKYGFYIPNHQDLTFKNIENIISLINE